MTQSPFRGNRGLASLVEEFAAQQCCDPHDHVYGLLGLLGEETTLAIDYNGDMELLFWQVLTLTHQQASAVATSDRRDSYEWNLETLLDILNLRLEDIFAHQALQRRIAQDRFAVEMEEQ
ncbi:hypothetical protein PRZ48_002221 [Zasmidium cellare]|uniref:Uncharacterized protein n=1 Tax=Zasmidium cellare TaxID=395010 RepID=A0ABR0F3F0_ZASCE|nr:hypothetical protein PRZ48_002221 [Zasmidium cellare]